MDTYENQKAGFNVTKNEDSLTSMEKLERLHPYQLILYLFLIGSSIIFLFLVIAHFATRPDASVAENFTLPQSFAVSSLLIIVTSYFMSQTSQLFKNEELIRLRNNLGILLFLGLGFCVSQYIGWLSMMDKGILFEGRSGGVYLYILSGLHFIHILGGIFYLLLSFLQVVRISKDPVESLVACTNPYEKLKLNLLVTFWYYLDITWLFVFFYFLISY
jgi:cytochrome c oxidase subunit 3